MVVVCLETEFRWELGKAIVHVHFDAVVLAALFVRWLEGAAIGWAGEGEELVEAIAEAAEGAACAIDSTVGGSSFSAVFVGLTDKLLRNFHEAIEDVADRTTELAGGSVLGAWRGLNVRSGDTGEDYENRGGSEEFFHAWEEASEFRWGLASRRCEER